MSFVQREIEKLEAKLHETEQFSPLWKEIYAARGALGWALEPGAFASPMSSIFGLPNETGIFSPVSDIPLPSKEVGTTGG